MRRTAGAVTALNRLVFADLPPSGLRLRLVRGWPWRDPELAISPERLARADRELAPAYRRVARVLTE
ncbi:MAG: hypothetical protein FWD74_02875 [Actinomycetia bacterium]|nr:hypothetical protein [Actinomycetes bacterium]